MDSRLREKLFSRPDVVAAEQQLRKAVATAAGTTQIGASQILRDFYRDANEARHPITRVA